MRSEALEKAYSKDFNPKLSQLITFVKREIPSALEKEPNSVKVQVIVTVFVPTLGYVWDKLPEAVAFSELPSPQSTLTFTVPYNGKAIVELGETISNSSTICAWICNDKNVSTKINNAFFNFFILFSN